MMNKKTNKQLSQIIKNNYNAWKNEGLSQGGYFIIFNGFQHSNKLKNISGNALKLYVYLGINSNSKTGEVWHSNTTIAKYFNKSERTIRGWMKELEDLNLIKRMQLEFNGNSHTYLQTYSMSTEIENTEIFKYKYRLKSLEHRKNVDLRVFKEDIHDGITKVIKDCYVNVYKNYFEIKSYKSIEQNTLRKIGKYIKDTNIEFDTFSKKYTYTKTNGEEYKSSQLFERIK